MKPSFALDFRDGVIALLHRTARGWHEVGATPVDAPDLAEALSYHRSTALGLSPRGLATKLVIPNEQILYTQVHAPGPDAAKRRRQIKAALEGLTPYKVDDLVYDWWGTGPEVHVAIVAKETLAEAEAFAVEHRFNPVSFVAAPDDGAYRGEPFFGPSALAATLLAEGEKVERDQDPIAVVAREFSQGEPAARVAEPASEPKSAPQTEPVMAEPVMAEPVMAELDRQPLIAEPLAETPVAETPAPDAQDAPIAVHQTGEDGVSGVGTPEHDPLPDFRAARAPAEGVPAFDPKAMALDLVDEAPMALDVTDEPLEPPVAAPKAAEPDRDVPAAPAAEIVAAFASRRTAEQVSTDEAPAPSTATPPPTVHASAEPADFAAAAEAKARKAPPVGPAPTQRPSVPRPALAKPAATTARGDAVPFPGLSPAAKLAAAKGKLGVTAPGIAGPKRDRNVVPMAKAAPAPTEAKTSGGPRPVIKGLTGLDGRPLPVRGKPRYLGLILTGILLLALAVVAFWSSFYLTSNDLDPGAAPPENAVATGQDPADEVLPSIEDEALADGQDLALADGGAEPVVAPDGGTNAATDLAEAAVETAVGAAAEAAVGADIGTTGEATAATSEATATDNATPDLGTNAAADVADTVTGVTTEETAPDTATTAALTPEAAPLPEPAPATGVVTDAAVPSGPGNDPQDEIFLAAADAPPQTSDPTVLPQLAANSDPPPALAAPPPPFGTVYTFDAEGRIQPTPEGIITPEGVLLIAGSPKVVPPAKPETLAPATATEVPAAPVTEAAPEVGADPALEGKKPKARPETQVAPDATADQQGEALAPAPDSRFAAQRPQKRPAALTETASTAPTEPVNPAAAASLATNGVQASVLAVAQSKRPAARPSGTDQAVDAAVAAALQAPDPQSEAEPQTQTASLAPEDEGEPEVEAPAPNLPTSASVAKQATVKDVLNLSRISLIGIFGTSNGRYAMIRQAGGGIKKVVVGDQIDGGRVAAISATALQYQKGGKMVTLSLPKG